MSTNREIDVAIIGAGFAGLYAVRKLRDDMGLTVQAYERGDGVGGTWFWNRYPGARVDAESIFYSYSFDEQLCQDWTWSERFCTQPELLAYADHVADRYDLRRSIAFETEVEGATFDTETDRWHVRTNNGQDVTARFLVAASGCLSASQVPEFKGRDSFEGPTFHTGQWPREGVDFSGMRVAVIGTGSSGVQAIPEIAKQADQVIVFQRTPTYSLPAKNRRYDEEQTVQIKADYPALWEQVRNSPGGALLPPPLGNALDLDEEVRLATLEERWADGGPAFMYSFADVMTDERANEVAANFLRAKIRETVKDPEVAALLTPTDYPIGAKRICIDTDYYATYNRPNVELVSLKSTPIEEITPTGVRVDGVVHEVDAIVFATGYDAMTGPLTRMNIVGADGTSIKEKWSAGPKTYLGIATAGFPNMFMVTAPGSPSVLSNMIHAAEQHVDWIGDYIAWLDQAGITRTDADQEAEDEWVAHVNMVADMTL
ncbi:MAG: NAD(P)/FAD-dependent oxidoreductase, partial [Aeromicrobium sp.]